MELIATRHGLAALRISRDAGTGPVWLVLHGLGSAPHLWKLSAPNAAVAHLQLPAFGGPTFARYDAASISDAFDDVITARFSARPILLVGISMGAVIGLGMRSRHVRAVVAIDPFLSSDRWPLIDRVRSAVLPARPDLSSFFEQLLGYYQDRVEIRTFEIRTSAPLFIVVGTKSLLPIRNTIEMPSLCSPADRECLTALGAHMTLAQAGHNILQEDYEAFRAALNAAGDLVGSGVPYKHDND